MERAVSMIQFAVNAIIIVNLYTLQKQKKLLFNKEMFVS